MLQAKLSDPILIGLWARSADSGFDHAVLGITNCLLLDPNIPGYPRFCFQPCPGCLTPSWLTYISSPSFFSVLPLFIWPVGFPPFLSCSLELLLSFFSLLLPSLPLLLSALPGCHGDPKWSALLVRHGDPKWSAALPTVPLSSTAFD